MIRHRAMVLACVAVFVVAQATIGRTSDHDKAFWRAVAADKYRVPAGASIVDLTNELVGHLASPDPEWRDTIAYNGLVAWIYQQKLVDLAQLRAIATRLTQNLNDRIGSTDTDAVFNRSFSALSLAIVVARDNAEPV